MNYGEAMREARKSRGITMEKLSQRSGISISTISQYERGRVVPGVYNLIDLADAIGISMDEYIGRREPWQTLNSNAVNVSIGNEHQLPLEQILVNVATTYLPQVKEELSLMAFANLLRKLLLLIEAANETCSTNSEGKTE